MRQTDCRRRWCMVVGKGAGWSRLIHQPLSRRTGLRLGLIGVTSLLAAVAAACNNGDDDEDDEEED